MCVATLKKKKIELLISTRRTMNHPPYPYMSGQQQEEQRQHQRQQQQQQQIHQLPIPGPPPPPGPAPSLQYQAYPAFTSQPTMLASPPPTTAHTTLPHPYQYPGFQQQIPQSISPVPPQSSPPQSSSQLPLRQFTSTPVVSLQQSHDGRLNKTPSTGGSNTILSPGPFNLSNAGSVNQISNKTQGQTPLTGSQKPIEKPKFASTTTTTSGTVTNEPLVHSYDVANLRGGSIISYDSNGHVTKPRVTTTMWEDEKTLCYQVEANGVSVVRRADNDMINGTKLLNVAKITRGRRDGILKAERIRHVVKIGSMHLKGVWIPFERAQAMAEKEKIVDYLYPLFVKDIKSVLRETSNLEEDRISRVSSPHESSLSLLQQPSQGPIPINQPSSYDPWYLTARNIPQPTTTILPQPTQFGIPTQSRASPPFAFQFTPAHTTYLPHPNTPNFDFTSAGGPNSRQFLNQNLAPAFSSVTPTSSEASTTTTAPTSMRPISVTPTASDTRQQSVIPGFFPVPQPYQLHQPSSQLLRPASTTSDTTDRSASESDSSKND